MKARRKWIIAGVVVAALAVAGILTLGSGAFQTWAFHRWLAAHPGLGTTVGRVSAAPGRLHLTQVRIAREGYTVVVPTLEADLPLFAALRGEVTVSRLVAKGLSVDLSQVGAAPGTAVVPASFPSLLGRIHLPVDLTLDGVD